MAVVSSATGPINVVIVSAVPAGVRAMAMAVSIFVIHALGDAISPPMIGCWPTRAGWPGPCWLCRWRSLMSGGMLDDDGR
jgi:hypothetical protein